MQDPTTLWNDENTERAPRYLDQALEPRDHANQWDVSLLMLNENLARTDEAE